MNYGRIGFFVAHEIAHSLDSSGIFITKDGEYFEGKNKTQENLENKRNCLLAQHEKYYGGNKVKITKIIFLFYMYIHINFNCANLIYYHYIYSFRQDLLHSQLSLKIWPIILE